MTARECNQRRVLAVHVSCNKQSVPACQWHIQLGKEIRKLLEPAVGVNTVNEIYTHRFNPYLVVNITIGADGSLTVAQGDKIATLTEKILLEIIEFIRRVYVHYHPASSTFQKKSRRIALSYTPYNRIRY